jgi:hypothetical protein
VANSDISPARKLSLLAKRVFRSLESKIVNLQGLKCNFGYKDRLASKL